MTQYFHFSVRAIFTTIIFTFLTFACSDDPQPIVITATDFAATIDENPTTGQALGTVNASVNRGTLTFAIESETFNGAININSSTGQLTVGNAAFFDFEIHPTITAVVTASSGEVSKEVAVTITLEDVNEVVVTVSDFSITLAENQMEGQIIGTIDVSVTGGTSELLYQLYSPNPIGAIAVQSNGNIMVNNAHLFNYELYPIITAVVRVTSGTTFDEATITITLTDVEETVQKRLDDGETPKQIYTGNNSLLNDLYGKQFAGGIIATFNTSSGSCLILSDEFAGPYNQSNANSAANGLNHNAYDDWRLPTQAEAESICATQAAVNNALPLGGYYWTSTNCGGICYYNFYISNSSCGNGGSPSSETFPLRAVRNYIQAN